MVILFDKEQKVKKKWVKKEIILDCCPNCGSKRCNDKKMLPLPATQDLSNLVDCINSIHVGADVNNEVS